MNEFLVVDTHTKGHKAIWHADITYELKKRCIKYKFHILTGDYFRDALFLFKIGCSARYKKIILLDGDNYIWLAAFKSVRLLCFYNYSTTPFKSIGIASILKMVLRVHIARLSFKNVFYLGTDLPDYPLPQPSIEEVYSSLSRITGCIRSDRPKVVCIGQISSRKCIDELLEKYVELGYQCVVVGNIIDADVVKLRNQYSAHSLLFVAGEISEADFLGWILASDIVWAHYKNFIGSSNVVAICDQLFSQVDTNVDSRLRIRPQAPAKVTIEEQCNHYFEQSLALKQEFYSRLLGEL
jgi:glycosyltransferase involved in cell wall biosynthesis